MKTEEPSPRPVCTPHQYPDPPRKQQLPHAFDRTCKCGLGQLEEMAVNYCTRVKPFMTFMCPKCMRRLFLIEAPRTPLLLWSDAFPRPAITDFSEWVEELIEKREAKRLRDELRNTGMIVP